MSLNSNNSGDILKIFALLMLGAIAAMALFPYASGEAFRLNEPELFIVMASAAAIVLVILSDRITSLKLTTSSLELQLSSIREELSETIQEVKEALPNQREKISKAESLVSNLDDDGERDLLEEAKDIGLAMKMLREVMREYKQ